MGVVFHSMYRWGWGHPCKTLDKTLPVIAIKRGSDPCPPRKRPGLNGGYLPPKPHRTTNFRSSRYEGVFAETRKLTPPYQVRKSQEVLRQTGFETAFAEKYRGRSQELLALRPTGSGASTPLERVGGQDTGGPRRIRTLSNPH